MVSSPSQPVLSEIMINTMSAVVEKEKPGSVKLIRARRNSMYFVLLIKKRKAFSRGLAQYGFCTIKPLKKVGSLMM